jgi:hypothetical protein
MPVEDGLGLVVVGSNELVLESCDILNALLFKSM